MFPGARLSLVVLLLAAGCLPRIPRQRLSERAKIAVGYVVDPQYAGAPFAPPEALKAAIKKELDDHNLELVEVPFELIAAQRLTDARFLSVEKGAGDARFLLLVEQRVQFFSQIDGRYRWEVGTALTASRGRPEPVSETTRFRSTAAASCGRRATRVRSSTSVMGRSRPLAVRMR